ncbi:hypothetical protein, partial [Dactylosporangium aurantiacum]
VAVTGWNEKRLRAAGRPYQAVHTHPASHAGYYRLCEVSGVSRFCSYLSRASVTVAAVVA